MNAERVHAIAIALQKEADEQTKLMKALVKALETFVSSPTDAAAQKQLADSRSKIDAFLAKSVTKEFSPAWIEALKAFNIDGYLGETLRERIDREFDSNQMTPAIALEKLKTTAEGVEELSDSTGQLLSAFDFYEIGNEELNPGECEIGFLIPRKAVDNHLSELGEEFKDINNILAPFAELTVGGRPAFEVRSLSTSEFGLYLAALPPIAAVVAKAVSWINTEYKKILEIRKLRDGMIAQGLPKESLKPVEDHANGIMAKAIGTAAAELMKEFGKNVGTHRQHELKFEIKFSLTEIAKRVDKGYNVEVRAEPPEDGELLDGNTTDGDAKAAYFGMIGAAQKDLQFIHHEGSPILTLTVDKSEKEKPPADVDKPHNDTPVDAATKSKKKAATKRTQKTKKPKSQDG